MCLVLYFGMQGTRSHLVQFYSLGTCPGESNQVFLFNGRNPMLVPYLPLWVTTVSEAHKEVVEFEG